MPLHLRSKRLWQKQEGSAFEDARASMSLKVQRIKKEKHIIFYY
jgi:hypothetical protein